MDINALKIIPESIVESNQLIAEIDAIFLTGFGRLSSEQLESLARFEAAFSQTPLGEELSKSIAALTKSEFLERHFLLLATARAALQGAQYDALNAQLSQALNRPVPELTIIETTTQDPPGQLDIWCEGIRHWLMELALAGFANLDVDGVLAFQNTLADIQEEPRMFRHAALLNGFIREILEVFPSRGTPEIPLFRWVDLWARAFTLSTKAPEDVITTPISGTLSILACDLRQHDVVVTLIAYGLLETSEDNYLVRISLSAFKVDVIGDSELKDLFEETANTFLKALTEEKSLDIQDMALSQSHDLVWDDSKAKLGKAFSAFEKAAFLAADADETLTAKRFGVLPEDRHPALVEELVYLENYKIEEDVLKLGDGEIDIALQHIADTTDFQIENVLKSKQMLGLLRFDSLQWQLQPLAFPKVVKKKNIRHTQGTFRGKKTKPNLPQLRERASRLLRKK